MTREDWEKVLDKLLVALLVVVVLFILSIPVRLLLFPETVPWLHPEKQTFARAPCPPQMPRRTRTNPRTLWRLLHSKEEQNRGDEVNFCHKHRRQFDEGCVDCFYDMRKKIMGKKYDEECLEAIKK